MARRLNVDEADEKVKEFLRKINVDEEAYIVESGGKPIMGLVPPSQVEKLQRDKEEVLALLRMSWQRSREVPEKVVDQEVERAVRRVRAQRQNAP